MIYWIQEATQAWAQEEASSSPIVTGPGALVGAVVGLVGVLIGQYLTQRRHSQALRQTAELEAQRAQKAAELEAQRADKDVLLRYFEVVGQLLTDPSKSDSLKPVIQAQTLTLLEALEPGHKRILLHFLYEVNLLDPEKPGLSQRCLRNLLHTAPLHQHPPPACSYRVIIIAMNG